MPEPFATMLSLLGRLLAAPLSALAFWWERRVKKQKLFDAVYYHIMLTRENLAALNAQLEALPQKIEADPSYTPYFVLTREDRLTYEQIIKVLRWLDDDEDEEKIVRYFLAHADIHAVAQSFDREIVQDFSESRKIKMVKTLQMHCEKTIKYAHLSEYVMKDLKNNKRRKKQKTLSDEIRAANDRHS